MNAHWRRWRPSVSRACRLRWLKWLSADAVHLLSRGGICSDCNRRSYDSRRRCSCVLRKSAPDVRAAHSVKAKQARPNLAEECVDARRYRTPTDFNDFRGIGGSRERIRRSSLGEELFAQRRGFSRRSLTRTGIGSGSGAPKTPFRASITASIKPFIPAPLAATRPPYVIRPDTRQLAISYNCPAERKISRFRKLYLPVVASP